MCVCSSGLTTTTSTATSTSESTVKCPLCAAPVSDGREVLLRHLTAVHHVDDEMCLSLAAAAGHSQGGGDVGDSGGAVLLDGLVPPPALRPPASSSAGGGLQVRRRRQFRCAFCGERFRTRVHCELHARAAHPRASGSGVEVTPATVVVDRGASPPPPPPTTSVPGAPPVYATPLDPADAARAQMLPYVLRESVMTCSESAEPPHFSTALVYLPTLRPVTSPTNVTFTLTPLVQP